MKRGPVSRHLGGYRITTNGGRPGLDSCGTLSASYITKPKSHAPRPDRVMDAIDYFTARPNLALAAITLAVLFIRHVRNVVQFQSKLPPGPRGYPVVGNLFNISATKPWTTFTEWQHIYGPFFYVNMPGRSMLVLNNRKVATALLEKRSSKYSDRPRFIVAGEIMSGNFILGFMRSGDVWKRIRKGSHEALNNQVARTYHPYQQIESYLLADSLIQTPNLWNEHLKRSATSFIMAVVYGTKALRDSQDPTLVTLHQFSRRSLAAAAGSHLVEFFPWMKRLPRWMSAWRREAEEWFVKDESMFKSFYNEVQSRMIRGDERRCVVTNLIEQQEGKNLSDQESVWLAGTMYAAGSDLSAATMSWWLIAMVAYPDVLKRAQEEIDRVVGRSRMPTFEDYDALPYIQAMVKEALRWRPVAPLGVPHRLIEDDYYEGYLIPKGTSVVANIWAINMDKSVYGEDAEDFNPGRYLDSSGNFLPALPDTHEEGHSTYGFGRRICVGRHVANHNLWMQFASVVWACDIRPLKDLNGNPILPDIRKVESDMVMLPAPFECDIRPRFPEAEGVLSEMIQTNNYGQI
ncbi:cytochrome P450 [Mycena galericulata]|nr:cytochrome P450 [Mycena galericulata]